MTEQIKKIKSALDSALLTEIKNDYEQLTEQQKNKFKCKTFDEYLLLVYNYNTMNS